MSMISINRNPSRRQLAVFGATWLVFFGAIGALVLHASGRLPLACAFWTAAVVVPLVGWIRPPLLRWTYVVMAYSALPLGWVVSHLLLAAIYFLLLTPAGLIMRLVGYDPMTRRLEPDAKTYWTPREEPEDAGRYFKQY